ncbi:uncharacterized protein LOC127739319 isoform X2 [Mytilus californianus]|uniref:uncharacterized protein LOC127739319 isoform X2 n=1 Tax=Mytilus californianus TaxID=6549 RepID=UPI0022472781|nr:uncharacterized protein LOC127739319 isoform X2 [Mytilus californianus]
MASISQLTEEERNFTRFFFLNFKVSPDIARRFFDGVFPPIDLAQTINSSMPDIIKLNKSKRINASQLNILRGVTGTIWTQYLQKALTSLNKGQRPHEVTEIFNYDLDGEQAKALANTELKQLQKHYMDCEKEKEQIESDLAYYMEGHLPKNMADANASLVETWKKDDESFYDTTGSDLVYETVKQFGCILVTSNSTLGKTATIRHIALKLQYEGFEIVSIEYPEDVIKYKTIKKQVFLIDDVLGKHGLNPNLLEKWERTNEKLISCLKKESGSHKVLCTLRSLIALNKRFENASTILNKKVINLEQESYTLSKEEKQQILIKHLKTNNLEKEINSKELEIMCETSYAFPLLCKLVSNDAERFRKRIEFFRQPLSLFRDELDKISNENKKLYCILVICMLYKGSYNRRVFDIDCDEKIKRIIQACGLQTDMSTKELEDTAVSAVGSYFTEDSTDFRFIHDALEETVGLHFCKFAPRVMFLYCDILFIRDRVRIHSNEDMHKNVAENIVIIREDELNEDHLQPLYNRLGDELTC